MATYEKGAVVPGIVKSVEAMIINVDRKARSIQLSIKARDNAETADSLQRMSDASASSGTTNLGALLKAKLDQARNDG